MTDDEYRALRAVLERELGISAELPHPEAVRAMEARQRKEADARWRAGKCECCVGCPDAYLCPHRAGDFPKTRRPRGRASAKNDRKGTR